MPQAFKDLDLPSVWESNSWANRNHKEAPFIPETLAAVESELGYKLPQSFTALMTVQNGGIFIKNCFPTTQRNPWAEDHVQVCEVSGIGFEKEGSPCDAMGQKLWLGEWEYPPIGVYLVNDPSAGYAMSALDHREREKDGEPRMVLVERGWDFEIVEPAPNLGTSIRNLRHEDELLDN